MNPINEPKFRRTRSILVNSGLVFLSIFLTLFVLEVMARVVIPRWKPHWAQAITALQESTAAGITQKPKFQPHPYLSYYPADIQLTSTGCTIRGVPFCFTPPPGTLRIACLGGSTTMGAYPTYLADSLKPCFPGQPIEVMDWGCSGWTILESVINYCIRGRLFHPDIIIVHHGINDVAPRVLSNFVFDYSHYRKSAQNFQLPWIFRWVNSSFLLTGLALRTGIHPANLDSLTVQPIPPNGYWENGVPPETGITYREAVDTLGSLCRGDRNLLLLAGMVYHVTGQVPECNAKIIQQHNQIFKDYVSTHGGIYVDVQSFFRFAPGTFMDAVHLTPWGDQIKSNMLAGSVSRLKGGILPLWITDSLDSTADLTGSVDYDSPQDRELVIHWSSVPDEVEQVHVYVITNGKENRYLGKVIGSFQKYLVWKPQNPQIDIAYRNGPQFGCHYQFSVWFLHPNKPIPPLVASDTVTLEQEK